jgi:hypothetical protein
MSTKATLAQHHSDEADRPSWHLYEEVFEPGVVYLQLEGVAMKLRTQEKGGVDIVLRLPIETAKQFGLHANVPPNLWAIACDRDTP